MKGFLIALQFMTRLPGPRLTVSNAEFAASMFWFPAIGIVVGIIVAVGLWLGAFVDSWVAALVALVVWVWVTGALHLDGLGDIADAMGAAHDTSQGGRDRLLAVLADPHIGSFGVVAIVLQLFAKLALLHGLAEQGPAQHGLADQETYAALVLIPFAARIGPLVWTLTLPPLHEGLGARFRDALGWGSILLWALLLMVAAWFIPALLFAIIPIALWQFWILNKVGGISGDGHGAGVEVTETILLLAVIVAGAIA